eukprot:Em0002g847a
MVNQLSKFSPNIAQIARLLCELLSTKSSWIWGPAQEEAFLSLKTELSRPTVLSFYDPSAETHVSADASSNGLGTVLLQMSDTVWKPIAYASRTLTETEQRYAQIKKEALAITWAYEKFSGYLLGKQFSVETDHKPLVPLLSTKMLDSLPPRVLRFRLRLMRFQFTIHHTPGKNMYIADALLRAPTASSDPKQATLHHCRIMTKCPDYPWQKVAADLFQLKTATYLAVVDYFSRYVEVAKLVTTTSNQVIQTL